MLLQLMLGIALSWAAARIIKISLESHRKGFSWMLLYQDGGMPSAHTALVVGTFVSLMLNGAQYTTLVLSAVLACIIINDALKVRWITGEQSKAINLVMKGKKGFKVLEESVGHTIWQVIAGASLGIIVPVIVYSVL